MVLNCRCGGVVISDGDEQVCSRCGIVYDVMSAGAVRYNCDVVAKPHEWWRLYRLNRMVSRPQVKADKAIEDLCRKMSLPGAVHRRAVSLHNTVVAHNLHRGWSIASRAAAVVTLACRLEHVPRTAKTVCDAAGVKTGQTHNIYSKIVDGLDIRVPPPDPTAFVGSIATACGIPETTCRRAISILRGGASAVPGKDPTTLAGAALYIACRESKIRMSQQSLADAANTSAVSLRLRQRDLMDGME